MKEFIDARFDRIDQRFNVLEVNILTLLINVLTLLINVSMLFSGQVKVTNQRIYAHSGQVDTSQQHFQRTDQQLGNLEQVNKRSLKHDCKCKYHFLYMITLTNYQILNYKEYFIMKQNEQIVI